MKLANFDFAQPIEFEEGFINTLVIENSAFYRKTVTGLLSQANGEDSGYYLSKKCDRLDFAKSTEIITDIFAVNFDTKQICNKILQAVGEEMKFDGETVQKIVTMLNTFAAEISAKLDFDVSFNELNDLSGIIKLFGFAFDGQNYTFSEKIAEYINFLSMYFGKKLFIILNLKSALTDEEIKNFFKTVIYRKINVLLIENKIHTAHFENEKVIIIDKELCEIT